MIAPVITPDFRRQQVGGEPRHLVGLHELAERLRRFRLREPVVARAMPAPLRRVLARRVHPAGGDRVEADPVAPVRLGEVLRQRRERRLRGGVGREERLAAMDHHRQDVDDGGRLAAPDRRLREALHHEERPAGVDVHQLRPDLGRRVEQPAAVAGRRGVDERVGPVEVDLGRVDKVAAVVEVRQIRLAEADLGAALRELARHRLALVQVAPGEHQPHAALGDQPPRDGEAEALGAAGDERPGASMATGDRGHRRTHA